MVLCSEAAFFILPCDQGSHTGSQGCPAWFDHFLSTPFVRDFQPLVTGGPHATWALGMDRRALQLCRSHAHRQEDTAPPTVPLGWHSGRLCGDKGG